MGENLKVGDVFEVTKGMKVYCEIPSRFVYTNTPYSQETTKDKIIVGETYTIPGKKLSKKGIVNEMLKEIRRSSDFKGIKFDKNKLEEAITIPEQTDKFDTTKFIGEYVVMNASCKGGGTGHGPHDYYPDGWHITARKLNNGKYVKNGLEVSFYQSGCFTVVNENVPIIRKMKKTFV